MRTLGSTVVIAFLLDQLTKYFAFRRLSPHASVPIIPHVFHLSLVENTGIAFGWFQGHPGFWMAAISLSVAVLLACSLLFIHQPVLRRMAYGLVVGGALGNWVDRIRFHHVIDFLDFRIWPVFNAADSFITIGVVLLIWFSIRGR